LNSLLPLVYARGDQGFEDLSLLLLQVEESSELYLVVEFLYVFVGDAILLAHQLEHIIQQYCLVDLAVRLDLCHDIKLLAQLLALGHLFLTFLGLQRRHGPQHLLVESILLYRQVVEVLE